MNCHKCKHKLIDKEKVHFLNDKLYCHYCYQVDMCFNCCDNVLIDNLFIGWSFEKDYNGFRQIDQLCTKCFVERLSDDQKESLKKELGG